MYILTYIFIFYIIFYRLKSIYHRLFIELEGGESDKVPIEKWISIKIFLKFHKFIKFLYIFQNTNLNELFYNYINVNHFMRITYNFNG